MSSKTRRHDYVTPAGAHLLFVDRADGETISKIETLIEKLELDIESRDRTRDSMDTDEQKNELQDISECVGKQWITWNAKWALTVKPRRK